MLGRQRRADANDQRVPADRDERSRLGAPTTPPPTTGAVDVRVTDQANGEITAIVITATDFRVSRSSQAGTDLWLTLVEGEHTFDLLKVVGQEESPDIGELEAGTYNQIRMDIQSVVITRGGVEIDGTVRSSVLRIARPFDVVAGETAILTFDFDANKSVISAGSRLILRPVVRLLVREGRRDLRARAERADTDPEPNSEHHIRRRRQFQRWRQSRRGRRKQLARC